jgi:hypothetical protein
MKIFELSKNKNLSSNIQKSIVSSNICPQTRFNQFLSLVFEKFLALNSKKTEIEKFVEIEEKQFWKKFSEEIN